MGDLTLAEFLAARLGEDEAAVKDVRYIWATDWAVAHPTRVLRQVEAGRKLLHKHRAERHEDCDTLRILAAVYSDHPDYRREWKP